MDPNHDPEAQPGPARTKNPLKQQGHHEEDIQSDGLHRIEPNVLAKTRVPDNAKVESEEGDEAGIRDGPVKPNNGKKWVEEEAQFRVLHKEVATVLEGIEEWECVSHC